MEIARKDKKRRRLVAAHGEDTKELLDYVRSSYEWNYARLSAINAARTMMKDVGDDEDWLPQFYISMRVWQEDMKI